MLLFCQCLLTCENSCGVILSCKISGGGGGGGLADFFGGGGGGLAPQPSLATWLFETLPRK